MQLVTGDYPDLQMLHQRALHQQLDFTRPLRLAALRLEGAVPPVSPVPARGRPKPGYCRPTAACVSSCSSSLNQQGNPFPLLERSNMFLFLLPDEEGERLQQKKWLQQWLQTPGGRRGEFIAALRPLRAGQAAAGLPAGAVAGAPGAGSVR